ncbi:MULTISPECIES: TIGR04372 family glycosyltransferase [Kamptonema]|uniref:TIGR04372 family glycosyltransferase n=1 Tax=Kamptonema TaxID=1501433 RepID=UPI0001DAC8A8|nr:MULTISPECIES: TIGR04372 family glycosyltransferase [Kamptonema]CBN58033.1 hypothetical protein OSCI_3590066 [Kamptonema sp. PCC 6506]
MNLENQTSNLVNCSPKLESPFFEKILTYCRGIENNANSPEFYLDLGQAFYRLGTELKQENFYSYQEIWEILAKQANTNDSLSELYDLNDALFLSVTSHFSDEDFVDELYLTYLKRSADVGGKDNFLNYLGDGTLSRQQCPAKIRQSSEFISLLVDSTASKCFQEAIAAYRRAVELNPDFDESYRYLGEALASEGKLDEAILAYRRAIEFKPNFHELHNSLGEIFYRLAMALNLQSFCSYSRLGEVLSRKAQENDSLSIPYKFNDEFFLQATSHLNSEQFVEELYRTYLKREPDKEGKNSFFPYISNGSLTRHQSIDHIRQSSEFTSLYISPIISFCLEEAIRSYSRAIALESNYDRYYHNLEKVLDRQAELDLKPDSLHIYHVISNEFYRSGKYDQAIKLLAKSAQIQNELAKTYQLDKLSIRIITEEWTGAIGHLGLLDYYMKMKILGWLPPHKTILLAAPYRSANPCYLKYWYRYFPVVIPPTQLQLLSPLTKYLEDRISVIALANGETLPLYEAVMKVQKQWETEKRPHLHTLSELDEELGWSCLQEIGVPKNAWFVALHVRDTGYVNGQWQWVTCAGRNAHIETYLLAIQSIVERGGWVIRMGDRQMKPLPPMPQVIDYAHSNAKSDWMDVFLWAKSRFFIGTTSGPSVVPPTFGVPCVLTNWASIKFRQQFSQDLFIPKLYWSESEQRYLTFTEMLSPAYIVTENVEYFTSIGVKVVDNTPEEINDLVLEMLERLEEKINYTQEDDLLQSHFAKLVDPDDIYSGARMGRNFLQKYAHLINLPPANFELYLQLGNTLVSQNQCEEALLNYQRAVELNPDSFECHHQLGKTFYSLASNLKPESLQLYSWLVELLAQPGQSNDFSTEPIHLNDSVFLLATSHLNEEDFVEELYRTYLKRAAEPGGKNSFLNYLGDSPFNRQQCPAKIRQSSEFISLLVDSTSSRCFQEAISAYRRAVELNPNSDESFHCLGESLASKGKLDEAILAYRRAIELNPSLDKSYYNLGKILAKQNHFDEAIFAYRYAIELNPNLGEVYLELGEVLAKNGNLEEAIAVYHQALELNHNYQGFFRNLVEIFVQQGNLEEAIAVYQQAVQIQLNNLDDSTQFSVKYYCKLAILLAEKGLLDEAVACFQQAPQIQPSGGVIYENIWKGLNQLAPLDEEKFYYPTEINSVEVYQYFSQTCQYTVMGMDSLTEANQVFLSELGLSLANLEIIRQDSLALEEIYINSFGGSPKVNLSREALKNPRKKGVWLDVRHGRYFQNSIVETGYIYLLCPMTGKIIRSNHSFSLHCPHQTGGGVWHPIHIYRFVSRETFYLTVNSWLGNKSFLYFPNQELIIKLAEERYVAQEQVINMFKVDAVSYWPQVKTYLSEEKQKKEVAVDLGFFLNLGHYLWNDLTGIQKLSDNLTLEKVDKFLIGPNEFFKFGDVFPEIPAEKIVKVADSWSLFKTIVDNNYMAVWTTDLVLNENLAQRIYQAAVKKCSSEFLQQVETSKKHFPLICFQIRTHCRVWLSQVEGIANIINNLYKDFPNIGVVFEGWSRPETEEPSGQNQKETYYFEYMIENNNALVEQIIALLDPQISTYNAIGRIMYEIIAWDSALDMFVAPGGSGACLISWIANKPGVFHGNTKACSAGAEEYWNMSRENLVPPVFLSPSHVTDVPNSEHTQNDLNYDCDWNAIYIEVLEIVKGLNQDLS